jgi:hypothetical protein
MTKFTNFDSLTQQVTQSTDVGTSVSTLISGIAEQVRYLKDNPSQCEAFASKLEDTSQSFASAIIANTPASETMQVNVKPSSASQRQPTA